MNPVSADDEVRIYKRIKFVLPLTGRLFGLSATGCVSDGNAFLKKTKIDPHVLVYLGNGN